MKCVPCRIRVPGEPGSCPNCGKPLEAVAELAELMGYRMLSLDERRTPTRVADIMARREMEMTVRLAARRWLDEAGSFSDTPAEAAQELPPL
jgi:hypothetical protein